MKNSFRLRPLLIVLVALDLTSLLSTAHAATLNDNLPINVGEVDQNLNSGTSSGHQKSTVNSKSGVASVQLNSKNIIEDTPPGGSMVESLARNVPGFQARSTGTPSGANRYQIRINGIQIGFDETGEAEINGDQILFDGIPLNNPLASYHGFSSAELPIANMFSGIHVVYGPGTASQHWFDAMGGSINFQSKSSSNIPAATLTLGGGSFGSFNASTGISTGSLDGWRTFVTAGYTRTGQSRVSPKLTGVSESSAIFIKTEKTLRHGHFTAAFYYNHTEENRPHLIPVFPFPGGSVNGNGVPGPSLAQTTSGFYYTPSADLWKKHERYLTYLGYLKFSNDLASNFSFHNALWYRAGNRLKIRIDSYPMIPKLNTEYYPSSSGNFGDRADFVLTLPYNTISFGGYYQQTTYDSAFAGYSSAYPGHELGSNSPLYYRNDHDHWSAASAFLQDNIHPTSWLRVTPGLNLINYHISVNNVTGASSAELYPNDSVGSFPEIPGDSRDFTRLAPSLAILGKINSHASLFANWSQNFQTQIDSAYGEGASHLVLAPNAPARINFFMAGGKYSDGPYQAQLSFVHQKLTDLAVQVTQAESQNIIVEPADETINGVNFLLRYAPHLGFNARVIASIMRGYESTINASGQPVNGRITGLPTYNLTFGVGYRMYAAHTLWSARLLDHYQSATYLSSDITAAPTNLQLPFSAANLINLSLSGKTVALNGILPGVKLLSFTLMIDNLLNRNYNVQGYVSAGGNYGPGSAGTILAAPGNPRAIYGEITAAF